MAEERRILGRQAGVWYALFPLTISYWDKGKPSFLQADTAAETVAFCAYKQSQKAYEACTMLA